MPRDDEDGLGATSGHISVERNQGVGGALKGWKTDLSYGGGMEYKFLHTGIQGTLPFKIQIGFLH